MESFGENLDYLCSMSKSEIQVGVLKKLSGTTLNRHDEIYNMVYSDIPPYDILSNDLIPFKTMQKLKRFARFWDIVYNSGNFIKTFDLLVEGKSVFKTFYQFSDWLYGQTFSTWQISLERITKFLFDFLVEVQKLEKQKVANTIIEDILKINGRKLPSFLKEYNDLQIHSQSKNIELKNKRQQKR